MNKIALPLVALVTLAACSSESLPSRGSFNAAGSELNRDRQFGASTRDIINTQIGRSNELVDLNRRFQDSVPTTVNFAFNSDTLSPEAQAILTQQAEFIRQFPQIDFTVYGHTDAVGSVEANRVLGQKRAEAAVDFLVSQGVDRSRLAAAVSQGESQPVVQTQEQELANRRTVTEVSGLAGQGNIILTDGRFASANFNKYISGSAGASDGAAQTQE